MARRRRVNAEALKDAARSGKKKKRVDPPKRNSRYTPLHFYI
jgi:hypothetical protein